MSCTIRALCKVTFSECRRDLFEAGPSCLKWPSSRHGEGQDISQGAQSLRETLNCNLIPTKEFITRLWERAGHLPWWDSDGLRMLTTNWWHVAAGFCHSASANKSFEFLCCLLLSTVYPEWYGSGPVRLSDEADLRDMLWYSHDKIWEEH